MLLGEVGKLREEKRNLQLYEPTRLQPTPLLIWFYSELGTLMCMRSKYGPGGEFDPDWCELLSLSIFVLMVIVLGNPLFRLMSLEMAALHRPAVVLLGDHFRQSQLFLLPKPLGAMFIRLNPQSFPRGKSVSKGKPKKLLPDLPVLLKIGPCPGLLGSVSCPTRSFVAADSDCNLS
jgi:hypothetical protein